MPLRDLLANNKKWVEACTAENPTFFSELAGIQTPNYLWIGCSDSRIPANQVVGLLPGELFVHRNVANVVATTDFNLLSVLQYAVEVLKVKHVIVCGHYGCGGVKAALQNQSLGLIDYWIQNIKAVYEKHEAQFSGLTENEAFDLLCELNVKEQVQNICGTNIVQNAWKRGQELSIHGLVYGLTDGLIKDLETRVNSPEQLMPIFRMD
jgi:carbonic anhydrase